MPYHSPPRLQAPRVYTACQRSLRGCILNPRCSSDGLLRFAAALCAASAAICRGGPLQSRHPPHHGGYLLPLPRSGQELAHGRHAPRPPRRSAEAHRATASCPSCPATPRRAPSSSASSPPTPRVMPPAYTHKELTAAQKDTIRHWVAEGAKYEGHWAYQPVQRPTVPAGRRRNPIDAFIQARLAREGLKPSPEADRRTLIRRVTLDLTGLPPTPEEVAAFVNDTLARRLRKAGRPPAGLAALRRTAGHALAGRRALCRYLRLPRRQRLPRLALSRLRAARLPRQQAVRRVHARATGRRSDAQRHRRAERGLGLQPPEPHLRRRRPAAQGISRQVRRRPRPHHRRRLDGQHARLRRMPRPQVRSVHARAISIP